MTNAEIWKASAELKMALITQNKKEAKSARREIVYEQMKNWQGGRNEEDESYAALKAEIKSEFPELEDRLQDEEDALAREVFRAAMKKDQEEDLEN